MTTVGRTPRRQPDGRLSNLVLEGGRRKKYVTRDAQGRFVVESPKNGHQDSETVTYRGEPEPPAEKPKGK